MNDIDKIIFRIWIKTNPNKYLINFNENVVYVQYIPYSGFMPEYKNFIGRINIEYEGYKYWSILNSIKKFKYYDGTELIQYLDIETNKWKQIQYVLNNE